MLPHRVELYQHPDGDEEERDEDVAERHQLGERLVRVVGLRDHESGEKRAEGQRCPRRGGAERGERPDEDDGDQEQLAAPRLTISASARGTSVRAATRTPPPPASPCRAPPRVPQRRRPPFPPGTAAAALIGHERTGPGKMRTPVARRPCGASISPLSVRPLSTIAVLDQGDQEAEKQRHPPAGQKRDAGRNRGEHRERHLAQSADQHLAAISLRRLSENSIPMVEEQQDHAHLGQALDSVRIGHEAPERLGPRIIPATMKPGKRPAA